jgi:hypothetical protein
VRVQPRRRPHRQRRDPRGGMDKDLRRVPLGPQRAHARPLRPVQPAHRLRDIHARKAASRWSARLPRESRDQPASRSP